MGVLSGEDIKKRIEDGTLLIEPFDSKYIGAASVDLTLGNEVRAALTEIGEGDAGSQVAHADFSRSRITTGESIVSIIF